MALIDNLHRLQVESDTVMDVYAVSLPINSRFTVPFFFNIKIPSPKRKAIR
jgi:hypothetical protein